MCWSNAAFKKQSFTVVQKSNPVSKDSPRSLMGSRLNSFIWLLKLSAIFTI